jgi:hypothetical protein
MDGVVAVVQFDEREWRGDAGTAARMALRLGAAQVLGMSQLIQRAPLRPLAEGFATSTLDVARANSVGGAREAAQRFSEAYENLLALMSTAATDGTEADDLEQRSELQKSNASRDASAPGSL